MSPSNRFGRPGSSATPAHVRSRNARRRRFPRSRRSRHEVAHRVHAARTVGRRCDERSVGRRQRDGVDAAVGRLRIHPRFHCGDPSAECALREVPMARGAGKVHRVREAPEIIQPLWLPFRSSLCIVGRLTGWRRAAEAGARSRPRASHRSCAIAAHRCRAARRALHRRGAACRAPVPVRRKSGGFARHAPCRAV